MCSIPRPRKNRSGNPPRKNRSLSSNSLIGAILCAIGKGRCVSGRGRDSLLLLLLLLLLLGVNRILSPSEPPARIEWLTARRTAALSNTAGCEIGPT